MKILQDEKENPTNSITSIADSRAHKHHFLDFQNFSVIFNFQVNKLKIYTAQEHNRAMINLPNSISYINR